MPTLATHLIKHHNNMAANIGIPAKHLQSLSTMLNTLLADEYVLYTKTRNYHWNVRGPQFMDLHKFFEGQYEELAEIIDQVAERNRSLGHFAVGTMKQYLNLTRLTEDDKATNSKQMLQNLLNDHETIARVLRNDLVAATEKHKDAGTGDFLTGLLEQHEKMAWFLRSYLE